MTKKDVEHKVEMVQFTQALQLTDTIEVPGGACKPPYRCSRCVYRVKQQHANPERKGEAYTANACERPNKSTRALVDTWFQSEIARVGVLPGRVIERRKVEDTKDGRKLDIVGGPRYALYVNDVRKAIDHYEEVEP